MSMKVKTVYLHNVLRVSDVHLDLDGHNLYLVGGRNGQGKSSTLNGLLMALCGKRGMDFPDVPLKDGENKGRVTVELSGKNDDLHDSKFTVERCFERRRNGGVKETLRILDSQGEEAPEPQTLLNRLYKSRGLDPLAFLRLKKKDQITELRQMLGLDFTDLDAEHKTLYAERALINKDGVAKKAHVDSMPLHSGVPPQEVSVSELSDELQRRIRVNEANEETRIAWSQADRSVSAAQAKVERLEASLAQARGELELAQASYDKLKDEASNLQDLDVEEIQLQISESEAVNLKVRENANREAQLLEVDRLRQEARNRTDRMQEIDDEKRDRIEKADWPVEGLGLDDEGVTYNGLPFEQAARSLRIRTSVKMAAALNPELRLLVCQFGNDLDDKSLEELGRIAEELDLQILLEVVTRNDSDEDRCQVIIEDGEAKSKQPTLV